MIGGLGPTREREREREGANGWAMATFWVMVKRAGEAGSRVRPIEE
jgi:hypothetical protein